jgi:hypothetical protein
VLQHITLLSKATWEHREVQRIRVLGGALNAALGRKVLPHESVYDLEGIKKEFLGGRKAPTMEQVFGLIPPEKRPIAIRDHEDVLLLKTHLAEEESSQMPSGY